jgi:hypothetical protein
MVININNQGVNLENEYFCGMMKLPDEMLKEIFIQCVSGGFISSLEDLTLTNKRFYKIIGQFMGVSLDQCPPKLKIVNAKILGCNVDDEPCINRFELLRAYQLFSPHVEGEALLLTICKGSTVSQLMWGSQLFSSNMQFANMLSKVPVAHTYRILIATSVSSETLGRSYGKRCMCM